MPLTISKLNDKIGAEISGVSCRELVDRHMADQCQAALDQHGVLVIRDANIDDDDFVAFSRLLGDLVVVPTREHEYPEIQTITLDLGKTNKLLASYRRGNFFWHIDGVHEPPTSEGDAAFGP